MAAEDTPQVLPKATLTPIDLPGQPATDKGYVTESGTKIRVRVVVDEVVKTVAPTNTPVRLAYSGYSFSVTCAKLNDDLTVASDATGALIIMNKHELSITDAAFQNPDFDISAEVDRVIAEDAYRLEQRVARRSAMAAYLQQTWSGADMPVPDTTTLSPPTSSKTVAEMIQEAAEAIAQAKVDAATTAALAAAAQNSATETPATT